MAIFSSFSRTKKVKQEEKKLPESQTTKFGGAYYLDVDQGSVTRQVEVNGEKKEYDVYPLIAAEDIYVLTSKGARKVAEKGEQVGYADKCATKWDKEKNKRILQGKNNVIYGGTAYIMGESVLQGVVCTKCQVVDSVVRSSIIGNSQSLKITRVFGSDIEKSKIVDGAQVENCELASVEAWGEQTKMEECCVKLAGQTASFVGEDKFEFCGINKKANFEKSHIYIAGAENNYAVSQSAAFLGVLEKGKGEQKVDVTRQKLVKAAIESIDTEVKAPKIEDPAF